MLQSKATAMVLQQLQQGVCTLEQLWGDHSELWHHLGWEQAQVRLWLRCLPGISIHESDSVNPLYTLGSGKSPKTPCLADQLIALLESSGKPLPLSQLIHKFPPGVIVTESMLRSAINADHRLLMTGPLAKLA
jgi:hypothetical protein